MQWTIDIEFAIPYVKNGYSYSNSKIVGTCDLHPERCWAFILIALEQSCRLGLISSFETLARSSASNLGQPPVVFCTLNATWNCRVANLCIVSRRAFRVSSSISSVSYPLCVYSRYIHYLARSSCVENIHVYLYMYVNRIQSDT